MKALEYASQLISRDTVSTKSNSQITDHLDGLLGSLGFETERIEYEIDGITKANVIGRKGSGAGGLAYFGHTDVVPVDDWSIQEHGPFEPTVRDNRLYGRGSTDMKGSIGCMLAAVEACGTQNLQHPVYICCSADEELDHRGIKEVIQRSRIFRELIAGKACGIVGEPTNMQVVYAHKGGVQIGVTAVGKAAHSSTNEGVNANLAMIPFLQDAKAIYEETEADTLWWDEEFHPPTVCLNIGINDHTPALNITAPQSICTLCFRSMPSTNVEALIEKFREASQRHELQFHIRAINPSFRRAPESGFVRECVRVCGSPEPQTVGYGSEAGNLSEVEQLVVLGPGDIAQAHKSDEWISLEQLEQGTRFYHQLILEYCS